MENVVDIRVVKKELRKKYRDIRENMDKAQKEILDKKIFDRLILSKDFINCDTILCFVSTEIEVDTISIIKHSLAQFKTVAVPKCEDKNGTMNFYVIRSLDDLEQGTFSLCEPKSTCKLLDLQYVNCQKTLCIMPGFAYDKDGYRIGFGKGYYDRFLNRFCGKKIAICYNECIANELPHGRYDVAAQLIVTPKYTITTEKMYANE